MRSNADDRKAIAQRSIDPKKPMLAISAAFSLPEDSRLFEAMMQIIANPKRT